MSKSFIVCGPPVPSDFLANIASPLYEELIKYGINNKDNVCMIDMISDEHITVDFIISQSIIIAAKLQDLGCKPQCIVGILCENRYEFLIIFLGILRTGATVTCFNPSYSIGEMEHTIDITRPYIMFSNKDSIQKLQNIIKKKNLTSIIVSIDEYINESLNYKDLLASGKPCKYVKPKVSSDDTALILFSSGSTGFPKGVMLSNRSVVFLLNMIKFNSNMKSPEEREISLSVIPMFHGYGILLLLTVIIDKCTIVNLKKFDEKLFLEAVQKYKVTKLSLVPALMVFLAKHPLISNYDLSSIRSISCGAAPLSIDIEERVRQYLGLDKIIKGYGLTETTVLSMISSFSGNKLGTVGKLAPGMIAKIIDLKTGVTLGPKKEGEICIKGILVMKGYYKNQKETEDIIDEDGWLHTGDVGYYDDDEDFFIVDRKKDLIKYKGFQVAPAELESILLQHKSIKDAAVVGVFDEIAGELPKAFVVKQENITDKELTDYVSSQVGPHMKLRGGVTFINEIPRNANGKILRKDLQSMSRSKL